MSSQRPVAATPVAAGVCRTKRLSKAVMSHLVSAVFRWGLRLWRLPVRMRGLWSRVSAWSFTLDSGMRGKDAILPTRWVCRHVPHRALFVRVNYVALRRIFFFPVP